MREKRIDRKELGKSLLVGLGAIGASALLFAGFTQAAMAGELNGTETVPTSYSAVSAVREAAAPDGYEKAGYTVVRDELYGETPGEKDLTREEAAELGAQMVWELFGVDLEDALIYMGYSPGTETFPRAFWSGDVRFGTGRKPGDRCYTFMIDAVTGERFGAAGGERLSAEVPLGLDQKLADNPGEYETLAEEFAREKGLVHGELASVQYNCQGYSNDNDPDITMNVAGTNGEIATVTFSRYSQKLLGVSYDASRRISEPVHQKLLEELEKKIAEMKPSDGDPASLIALS